MLHFLFTLSAENTFFSFINVKLLNHMNLSSNLERRRENAHRRVSEREYEFMRIYVTIVILRILKQYLELSSIPHR